MVVKLKITTVKTEARTASIDHDGLVELLKQYFGQVLGVAPQNVEVNIDGQNWNIEATGTTRTQDTSQEEM